MTRYRVIQNIITFRHRYPHLHQLLLEDTKECGNQTCSVFMLSLTSRIATLCRSCLKISSPSFPVCRLTCLFSFVKIQFKTNSKIFIQKIFIQLSSDNSIELFIQKNLRKIIQNSEKRAKIWFRSPPEAPVWVKDP